MPNDHRGRGVHGGKVTDDEEYSFSVDDILGAFDPYQESKLRTLGYEQDETFRSTGTEKVFSSKDRMSNVTVPKPSSGGDWPVVRNATVHTGLHHPTVISTDSLGRLPDGTTPAIWERVGRQPISRGMNHITSGGTMDFWDPGSKNMGSEGSFRTPYRAALAAAAMSKRAADPTRNLRTGRKMDNV
jgi:hypothetical protein